MGGQFIGLPLTVKTSDGVNTKLVHPFVFVRPNGERVEVESGSESDGASTPPVLWALVLILVFLPPFGKYWPAAYLHDFLYRMTNRPKWECDLILFEGMEALGVVSWKKWLIYLGVRYGGWHSFKEDRAGKNKFKHGVHVRLPFH